jgi:hypothetical protein
LFWQYTNFTMEKDSPRRWHTIKQFRGHLTELTAQSSGAGKSLSYGSVRLKPIGVSKHLSTMKTVNHV